MNDFGPMSVQGARIPHGEVGHWNGWYTYCRGALISRRTALRVLLFGPVRGRIETVQSNDSDYRWGE